MPEREHDVDTSIDAGWESFRSHLAALVRDLDHGGTFDIAIPVVGDAVSEAPYLRFTALADSDLVELPSNDHLDDSVRLTDTQLVELRRLGWIAPDDDSSEFHFLSGADTPEVPAELAARTLQRVFAIPHPAFLHDASAPERTHPRSDVEPLPEDPDFTPTLVSCPDTVTRAIGTALAEVYARDVAADDQDVFAVPAGSALLFVRAHRSLPLVLFRSPLVTGVRNHASAATEVAILNRDSLWCRYVFDGETIYGEAELVCRVFVPVNFKIRLTEVAAELDDVDEDLALRVDGKRWADTGPSDGPREDDR